MTPKQRIIFFYVCLTIIVLCVFYFASRSSGKKQQRTEAFRQEVEQDLSAYGDTIDHLVLESSYVGVYVNATRWNASSKDTQTAFVKEIYALVQSIAKSHNQSGTLAIYTSDRKEIGLYNIGK